MIEFLRSIQIDLTSFWFGFLTATVFWLLFVRFRPHLAKLFKRFGSRVNSASQNIRASIENRHRSDTIKHAQGNQLAASLFSLDEILIPPRLLAQSAPIQPDEDPPSEDVVSMTIPYMPDWPELASAYYGHTISMEEAISGGINIAIVGPPGCGKTTALGYLASQLARKKVNLPAPEERIPIFVHAANLEYSEEYKNVLESITKAVAINSSPLSVSRLPKFINSSFESGRAFLLIDGLDELPPDDFSEIVEYIWEILEQYPQIQMTIATDANKIGNLPNIGFATMPMAIWGNRQQAQFAQKWGSKWSQFIEPELQRESDLISPLILNGWSLNRHSAVTPLEFTLRLWATYAGDVRGPSFSDAIEAYLLRMTVGRPKAIEALERFATQALLAQKATFSFEDAESWAREVLPENIETYEDGDDNEQQALEITVPRILPKLSKSGLLTKRADDELGFNHIIFAGYLAGRILSGSDSETVFAQSDWPLKNLSIQFNASHKDISPYANGLLTQIDDTLHLGAISIGRWLREIPLDMTWRRIILGRLSNFLSDEDIPLGARTRILSGLANTNDPDISALFRHLLKSQKSSVRQLAILGSGYQRDTQAVQDLIRLLGDQANVGRAAALALANIGTQPALEALATALLQGSEEVRQAVAETFANHPQEGHPTLREAVQLDDLLVCRAAIYGLKKIRKGWAYQILEEMQIEEAQWVVKNAAAQAIEEINNPDDRIPKELAPISKLPWLVTWASEKNVNISTGESAWKTMVMVLKEGSEIEQLAAMNLFERFGYAEIFPFIFDQLQGNNQELKEAAYKTIWHLAATGAQTPSPKRYGLG